MRGNFMKKKKKKNKSRKPIPITAAELDRKFDEGKEDVLQHFDLTRVRKVNVDFPIWVIDELDREAQRLGVPRQSLIKMWIAQKLDEKKKDQA